MERAKLIAKIREVEARLAELTKENQALRKELENRPEQKILVLSVEDEQADRLLLDEMFRTYSCNMDITFVGDGLEALDFLLKKGKYAEADTPQLILLDLNLPKMDGREFLKQVRTVDALKNIPILVLTTSEDPNDASECRRLGANGVAIEPHDLTKYAAFVRSVEEFWVTVKPPLVGESPSSDVSVEIRN